MTTTITVPNRVPGSGGLPALTRVGNPEGTKGDGEGWDGFDDDNYLTGLQLDHGFADNATSRLIAIQWEHKAGAPASGDYQYLIARAADTHGGVDIRLRDSDYDRVELRPYTSAPSSAGPQNTPAARGTTWWTFWQVRDPTYGGVGNDADWWHYDDSEDDRSDNASGGTGLTANVEWDAADHHVGARGGVANTGADDVYIRQIRVYDVDPTAAAGDQTVLHDIEDGTDDHEDDMVLWYSGKETTVVVEEDPPEQPYTAIARDRWGEDLVLPSPGETVQPTPTGDWPTVAGRPNLHAAHRRRAVAAPGQMVHRPEYGGGLPLWLEQVNSPAERARLAASIRQNALRDRRVEEVGVAVSEPNPGQTEVQLSIRPRGEPEAETTTIVSEG